MSCRFFIDEVGNDDVRHPSERFLSLTGIITKISGHDKHITPEIERLKADLFGMIRLERRLCCIVEKLFGGSRRSMFFKILRPMQNGSAEF